MAVEALRTMLKEALARKDALRALLEQTLDQRSCYVQAASNGNRAAMMTSALGVQRKRHKVGPLDPPLGLRVIPGPSEGEVILTWGKVKHARLYNLQHGPEGGPMEDVTLTGRRKRTLKLPRLNGVPHFFRIAACGTGGVSDSGSWRSYREEITVRHRYFSFGRCLVWDAFTVVRYVRKKIARSFSRH
jgi:hypothetical protein